MIDMKKNVISDQANNKYVQILVNQHSNNEMKNPFTSKEKRLLHLSSQFLYSKNSKQNY